MDVFKNQQFTLQKSFTVKFSQQRSVHTRRNQSFRSRKALGLLRASPQGSPCADPARPLSPSSIGVQNLGCSCTVGPHRVVEGSFFTRLCARMEDSMGFS